MTENIVEFIGRTGGGLNGVFAGVMTACSFAMQKHHSKLIPLLNLVYRDEIKDEKDNLGVFITQCVEYMKYKMVSLAQNKKVLNIDEYFMNDPEYFNQNFEKIKATLAKE